MGEVSTGTHFIVFLLCIFAFCTYLYMLQFAHTKKVLKKPLRISFSFRLSSHRASKQRKIMSLITKQSNN